MTDHNRDNNEVNALRARFESFAEHESARLGEVIRAAQLELKAYEVVSRILAYLEHGDISDVHQEPFESEQAGVPSGTITSFRLPFGASGRIRRYEGVSAASIEIGHSIHANQSRVESPNEFQSELIIYVRPDPAYELVRVLEFDPSDPQKKMTADTNLPPQAINSLADNILAILEQ